MPSVEVSGVTSHAPPSYPVLAFISVGTSLIFSVPLPSASFTVTVLASVVPSDHVPLTTLKVTVVSVITGTLFVKA